MSLRDLAEHVNLSYTAIGLAERGLRGLNNEDLKTFTDFFGVSADYLLGFSDVRNQATSQSQLKGQQLALYNGTKGLSESQMQEILNFVEFVKSKNQ